MVTSNVIDNMVLSNYDTDKTNIMDETRIFTTWKTSLFLTTTLYIYTTEQHQC